MNETAATGLMTPQWLLIVLGAAAVILFGPRRWVLPTLLVVTAFCSNENRIYVLGNNFFTARILLLFGWVRVLSRGEHRGFQFLPMDKAWILFSACLVLTETMQRGLAGTVYGVATKLYDGLGTYFLVRILLQEAKMFRLLIATFAAICCVLACFMAAEYVTHRNWMGWLGALYDTVQQRGGRLRCQATFAHPVLAGTYGAVLLPLFIACWWQPGMKRLAAMACVASTVMVITAGSAGPLMTFAAVALALLFWPLRTSMRPFRWAFLFMLLGLHLVMKAPVWALIARVRISGGTSYHRYRLLDTFIEHFRDWWLIGVRDTESWGWLMDDVANTFLIVAKHGGLLGLVLFIWVLVHGFRQVGLRRREAAADRPTELLVWAFGASLFGHIVSFFGTSYFDQTAVLWHATLAMLASLYLLTQPREALAEAEAVEEVGGPIANSDGIPIPKPLTGS